MQLEYYIYVKRIETICEHETEGLINDQYLLIFYHSLNITIVLLPVEYKQIFKLETDTIQSHFSVLKENA